MLDARLGGLGGEREARVDVDLLRELRVTRARRVADDRRQMHHRLGALQRVAARHRVADVALDDRHAALAQLLRPVRLTVQQAVEDRDLAPRL